MRASLCSTSSDDAAATHEISGESANLSRTADWLGLRLIGDKANANGLMERGVPKGLDLADLNGLDLAIPSELDLAVLSGVDLVVCTILDLDIRNGLDMATDLNGEAVCSLTGGETILSALAL